MSAILISSHGGVGPVTFGQYGDTARYGSYGPTVVTTTMTCVVRATAHTATAI